MPTNLAIDDKLIEAARKIGHHKTKKEAVTTALSEYIAHRKRLEILDLFGTVDFDPATTIRRSVERSASAAPSRHEHLVLDTSEAEGAVIRS
jgi:hypothetical protein